MTASYDGPSDARPSFGGLSVRWWGALAYATFVTTLAAAAYLTGVPAAQDSGIGFGQAVLWQGTVYGSWALCVPLLAWLGRRANLGEVPWLASSALFAALSLLIVPMHAAFTAWAMLRLGPQPAERVLLRADLFPAAVERLPVDLLIYWAIVGVLYATSYHAVMITRERAAGQLEAALIRAELHALRAQLEPHFLFNALQSISALIPSDPDGAQRMTARLGDLLRTTLRRIGVSQVTLAEEIELLEHYVAIERIRFGDRLQVNIDVADDVLPCRVPDLITQPLVENAVRHGIGPLERGGTVTVTARRTQAGLELTVSDDGVGLPAEWDAQASGGLGLGITRQRLQQMYDGRARFEITRANPAGTLVRVLIPGECTTVNPASSDAGRSGQAK